MPAPPQHQQHQQQPSSSMMTRSQSYHGASANSTSQQQQSQSYENTPSTNPSYNHIDNVYIQSGPAAAVAQPNMSNLTTNSSSIDASSSSSSSMQATYSGVPNSNSFTSGGY